MTEKDINYLLLTDEKDIIEFEKGLYIAFTKMSYSPYRNKYYEIIDGIRYKNNIPYSDQKIYGIKKGRKLFTAFSVRINIKDQMIIERIGFTINPEDKEKNICEGIDYYSLFPFSIELAEIYTQFFRFILSDLKNDGFEIIYASCDEKIKIMYQKIGFKFIDKIKLNDTYELLTRMSLKE